MEPPQKKSRPMVPLFSAPNLGTGQSASSSEKEEKSQAAAPAAAAAEASPEQRRKAPVPVWRTVPVEPSAAAPAAPPLQQQSSQPLQQQSSQLGCSEPKQSQSPQVQPKPKASDQWQSHSGEDSSASTAVVRKHLGPTPRAPDCTGGGAENMKAEPVPDKVDPGSLHKGLRSEPLTNVGSGVYGLDSNKTSGAGKAIALRLEPLKPGLPEYEKVLGENKQTVLIGSQRGVVDVLCTNEAVSKKHTSLALVGVHGELALSIMDTSTNGTYVNGKRLEAKKKRYRIRSGDLLQLVDPSIDAELGWKVDFGNTVAFFSRV